MDENNVKECRVIMMNTPERSKNNQMAAANGKFEDSPMFSFLDSLSPIKPVKSAPFTQTINPLSFSSFPAVFTSPHANSLKECRFIARHQLPDPSKPEFSFDDGNSNKSSFDSDKISDDQKENFDPISISDHGLANYELSYECLKLTVECAENLNFDDNTTNPTTSHPKVPFSDSQVNLEGIAQIIDQNKDECISSYDLDDLISDPSDLLMFGLPQEANVGPAKKPVDPALSFYTSIKHAIQNTLSRERECLYDRPGEEHGMMETDDNRVLVSLKGGSLISKPCENMDYQLPGLYRGAGKRCLVYDVAGARLKPSMMRQLDENFSSNQQLFLKNAANNTSSSSQRALPGMGLHLNAIAPNLEDYNNDVSTSRRLSIGPNMYANFHTLPEYSFEMRIDNAAVRMEDSGFMEAEENNNISPKKKKPRLEQGVDGEGACKRCNCKKSKCLKLYCECFAAGVYCVEPCACIDCFNKPVHEDTVLATRKQIETRNPLAFAPKVIRGSDSVSETGDDFSKTPASARHKRGCNCKKSGCLKKYCECYQGGVGCSINCRCEGCKNVFGTKDGPDGEYEEDETNTTEKAELSRSFRKAKILDNIEQSMDSGLLGTPSTGGRSFRQMDQPISTRKRPYKSSSFPWIYSSTRQGFGKSTSFFPPQLKLNQFSKTLEEEQMPEFLLEGSPKSGVKSSSSPNGKRVSPPQHVEMSPGLRSSRKLILQSIPSFPSLANK